MTGMRILFFSHYYPPEVNAPASRTSEHCRLWVAAGHDVTVVTSAPNHPRGVVYPGYKNRWYQTEMIDGVRVVRVWTLLAANEGFARRSLNYLTFMLSAILAMLRLPRPDVYISTSPQFFCGLVGLFAKTLRRTPWVLEIRDLWPESIVTVGAMRKGRLTHLLESLERLAYRRADRIVAVTDSFVMHIAERCQGAHKIDIIKNGVDLSHFKTGQDGEPIKQRFGLSGRLVAAYVGTHGLAHGLDTVLDAAALLQADPRIGFLLVGDGAERDRLVARAASTGLSNVMIAGQLPKADMPAVWAATDISLIVLKKSDTFTKVLPSKMFEAMAMACPIVLGVDGEARSLLEASAGGIAVTPESASELSHAIRRLADDADLRRQLGENGATFVRTHFDRSRLATRYLDVLTGVVAAGRSSRQTTANLPSNGAAS
jgi:glycosyltransferase involved in cell wall biosynthesis